MRRALLFLLLLGGTQAGGAAELVGFKNIALKPDERIWSFEIELKEGRIVALSKLPVGWEITLESFGERGDYKEGGGEIRGNAGVGHDAWSPDMLAELGPFLLLDESKVHHQRAALSGVMKISGAEGDRYKALAPMSKRRLTKRAPAL